jgi:cyclic beta-1,2-glucan synthetase
LALAVYPVSAVRNLERLARLGITGLYGFLEAADFTPQRVPSGRTHSPVRAYMAHHQGMILAAVGNALHDDIHVRRFSADMRMRTSSLLLQERVPSELPAELVSKELPVPVRARAPARPAPYPWRPHHADLWPQMHFLGNGRFATWVSAAGGGALWWHGHALTRWIPDAARDDQGQWIYVHDADSDALWSVGRQPAADIKGDADVIFHPHMVEFHRRDHGVAIRMEVAVAPGDDLEIRRIVFVNGTGRTRKLRITSYAEVVLAPPRDDERHPAFSKLFVGSEYLPALTGLLFTRRPRHPAEQPPTLFHRLISDDRERASLRYETDRGAFFGRNSGPRRPRGAVGRLTGSIGWTLDPIMALQFDLDLEPWETRQFAFLTLAAGSRESVLELAERYATLASVDWALQDAAREADHEARELDIEPERLPEFQSLASLLAVPQIAWHATAPQPQDIRHGQPRLWALGLSGDNPVLVIRMNDPREADLLRVILRAQKLWRYRLFHVDLVLLRMGVGGYVEPVRERALKLIQEAGLQDLVGRHGGIHLLFADHLTADQETFLEATACAVLENSGGPLARQIDKALEPSPVQPEFEATKPPAAVAMEPPARPMQLQFENDFGGFSADGKEYVMHLDAGDRTPAPWCNVLANDKLGCVTTDSGGGFTWALNSGENRLTPWSNDPVLDPPGEVLYLRDEETAEIWTPTPAPAGAGTAHQVRHGAGYTKWQSHSHGLEHELLVFVSQRHPVKIARLRLRNVMSSARRITATYYAEWLLGALRSVSRPHVVSRYDADCRALLAHNAWNPEFSTRVAFLASSQPPHSITTDRKAFIGREGDLSRPAGLLHWDLGGHTTTKSEPCAAFQVHLDIAPGNSAEVVFILGQGRDQAHARALVEFWRRPGATSRAFADLQAHWDRLLGAVQVQTPDPAFDLMVNRWLLYQTIASRILARAGFYQASGAIGFRDQLQDILALLHCDPGRAKAHILDCAARQFQEGDVLHWWHPPQGRGVRTRCSDDLLWLPYVTSCYVEATGDESILAEQVPFLQAPELGPEEGDRYGQFEAGSESASLFEHCQRALERGVTQGAHRLPLIAAGDWNDGMNRVGALGRGESVWLGWFAIAAMNGMCGLARRMNRAELADRWKARARELRDAIEQSGWDGEWYLRAFDDDGHPWGSAQCDECRIDSIAQSWSVLSGAGDPERARKALAAAERELVSEDERLIRLLWPPFHHTLRDPGYIKAYPPGVRENGGQYSHAAAWRGHALAALGDGDGAWRIFDLLNPIRRCRSRTDLERYRAEPYVLAADIASVAPHVGRGGWTWYTGAAGWTWRLGVEGILGVRLRDGEVLIDPCLPKAWGSARVKIAGPRGSLAISIEDPEHLGRGLAEVLVDGSLIDGARVAFPLDGSTRKVRVRLQPRSVSRESEPA